MLWQRLLYSSVAVWIFLLPWQTHYILAANTNQYQIISLYLTDVIWLVVMVLWLIHWYRQPRTTTLNVIGLILLGGLVCLVGASAYWADNRDVSFYYWLRSIQASLVCIVALTTAPPLPWLTLPLTSSGLVQAGLLFWQFFQQKVMANSWLGLAEQFPETAGVPVIVTDVGRWLRPFGSWPHPNTAGGWLVLCGVAAISLWYWQSGRWWRYASLISTILISAGIVLSFSRGAMMVWYVMLGAIVIAFGKAIWPIITVALISTLIFMASFFNLWQSRIIASDFVEQYSLQQRHDQWQAVWPIIQQYWPRGVGMGHYPPEPIHFVPLLIAAEIGIFGAVLLYTLVAWSLRHRYEYVSVLLITILLLGLFDHYLWTLPSMLLLWFYIIGLNLAKK
ncbi:MAG: O-antigen ligase family protein [Candidatus Kerfeldbacteria bacterium]|nr:O-antigen ligase family protein [Candidatus Kerfeldbacteria bacterium]